MKKIILILLLLSLTLSANKKNEDINHLELCALLLKDGYLNRANDELKQVNLEDEKVDKIRFYTIKGLLKTKLNEYEKANLAFHKSLKYGQIDKNIYLYIAQNNFKLQKYEQCINAINDSAELGSNRPNILALKAESYFRLKKYLDALNVLNDAINKFSTEYSFYKQRFNYFITLKLYQSALDDANTYLTNVKANERTTLSFISALRIAKQIDKAINLAEKANLEFAHSADVTVLLAHLYLDKDMTQAAAELFNEASIKNTKYIKEAAEMMRRAKKYIRALYKNSQMLDAKEKLKQQIAIYLEHGAYERIVVSAKALKRTTLLEDENIRYALAYSYYMVGKFESSEIELKKLKSSNMFTKAIEIRKNIQKCKDDIWECQS